MRSQAPSANSNVVPHSEFMIRAPLQCLALRIAGSHRGPGSVPSTASKRFLAVVASPAQRRGGASCWAGGSSYRRTTCVVSSILRSA